MAWGRPRPGLHDPQHQPQLRQLPQPQGHQDRGRKAGAAAHRGLPRAPRGAALARAGVHPKVMQVLTGHATCAVTIGIHTHVNMDSKREAAEALRQSMVAVQAAQEDAQPEEPRESPTA